MLHWKKILRRFLPAFFENTLHMSLTTIFFFASCIMWNTKNFYWKNQNAQSATKAKQKAPQASHLNTNKKQRGKNAMDCPPGLFVHSQVLWRAAESYVWYPSVALVPVWNRPLFSHWVTTLPHETLRGSDKCRQSTQTILSKTYQRWTPWQWMAGYPLPPQPSDQLCPLTEAPCARRW